MAKVRQAFIDMGMGSKKPNSYLLHSYNPHLKHGGSIYETLKRLGSMALRKFGPQVYEKGSELFKERFLPYAKQKASDLLSRGETSARSFASRATSRLPKEYRGKVNEFIDRTISQGKERGIQKASELGSQLLKEGQKRLGSTLGTGRRKRKFKPIAQFNFSRRGRKTRGKKRKRKGAAGLQSIESIVSDILA